MLWLLCVMCAPIARADVTVSLEVAAETGVLLSEDPGTLLARTQWFGALMESDMVRGADGIWRAEFSGLQARAVGMEIWRTDTLPHRRVSQTLEVLPRGDATISYAMSRGEDDAAWRLSRAMTVSEMRSHEETRTIISAVWTLLATFLVLVLGRRALARSDLNLNSMETPPSYELIGWFVFAVFWTWPAAIAGSDIVGRHFDALGTVWVIDSSARLGLDLHDSFSAWPDGVTYSAIDSWLLILFSWVGVSLSPHVLHGWLAVIGVATSGFAASRLARELGARPPTHLLAGVLFAGSGLLAAALLEGHVYQVVNPWMPWMAMYLHRATQKEAHWEHGLLAGLCFTAALFSSGYLGLSAGLVGLGLGAYGLATTSNRRPLLVAACVGLAASWVFLQLFSTAGTPGASHATMDTLRMGSLSLNSIGPATAEVDRTHHSWALALSALMVALAVLGVRVVANSGKVLFGVAVVAALIAMGPEWALGIAPEEPRVASVFAPLWTIPEVRFLRFPGRIMWAAILPLSALAALGMSFLMTRLGRKTAAVVALLVVGEVMVTVRLPERQLRRPADVPDAYRAAEGAVFDLVGEGISSSRESDSWLNAILCQYQTQHARPIADDCVAVGPDVNPRVPLSGWVANRLIEGNSEAVFGRLRGLGFTALAVHYDWIGESDRVRIQTALEAAPVTVETERGDGVSVYPFHAFAPMDSYPEGPPGRFDGPKSTDSFEWSLRVDLVVPLDREQARYFVEFEESGMMELKDKANVPGAQYEDGLFSLRRDIPVQSPGEFRLVEINDGRNRVLWTGTVVPLDLKEDRLSFRMSDKGSVSNLLRSMDIHSPEVRSKGGKILGLGWLSSLLLFPLWWARVRRDQRERASSDSSAR